MPASLADVFTEFDFVSYIAFPEMKNPYAPKGNPLYNQYLHITELAILNGYERTRQFHSEVGNGKSLTDFVQIHVLHYVKPAYKTVAHELFAE
ncbi:MAG: hypothetical protein R3A45_08310 [Bdellovibrionota bacterium]